MRTTSQRPSSRGPGKTSNSEMYASSFILTLDRIHGMLERLLSLETFHRRSVAEIVNEAVLAIEDVGELATVALRNARIDAYDDVDGDDAITEIIAVRIDEGFDAELPESARDEARAAGRVTEIGDTVFVPVDRNPAGARNWWLLTEPLLERLGELIDGFRRVHRRSRVDASDRIDTAIWTVAERLAALRDAIEQARTRGAYTARSVRRETASLDEAVVRFATAITGGDNAQS